MVHVAVVVGLAATCSACSTSSRGQSARTTAATQAPLPRSLPSARRYGGAENYIGNPSFEGGIAPWTRYAGYTILRRTTALHYDGRAAARVVTTIAAAYGIQLAAAVGVPARNETYHLSAWLRSPDRPKNITVLLTAYGPGNKTETVARRTFAVDDEWTELTVQGRVRGARRSALAVVIFVQHSIAVGDSFYLDAVSLTNPS